ncbi:siderophore biosynthesis protein [Paenibacillus sp. GSMTC-2017]|uniref:IucA/IucC family protein n=1 Tax=Paenibacillus sp. GSMTC-2017 TaxID=2794350 RepID=UPI0018D5C019|nr:IucA/IucC family protein [Paenibacillus sp. GSMTC-2017]MBH5319902.1 siderophore biosynthesis protein [Paenibacillus sp. GSMTC-2017]
MNSAEAVIDASIVIRRKVFRKLIEALLFEGLLKPKKTITPDGERYEIEGVSGSGVQVIYECIAIKKFTFDIIRLTEQPLIRCCLSNRHEAESVSQFIEEALNRVEGLSQVLPTFLEEIEETIKKDAMFLNVLRNRKQLLLGLSFAELEGLSSEGHPYHPCYKSRIGFNEMDNVTYGPEFEPEVRLYWIAAHQSDVQWNVSGHDNWQSFLTKELHHNDFSRFQEIITGLGLETEKYIFIPLHPWQWEHLSGTASEYSRLIPLGYGTETYSPQQSIRTLTNRSAKGKSDVKLALNIVNTSSRRNLTIHSVAAASTVSNWLQSIVDSDDYLTNDAKLILLHEYAGVSLIPAEGKVSAIWRENVEKYVVEGEEAVPFHMLSARESNGAPFIAPWVNTMGVEDWFRTLIRNCVIPVVHLLVAHGIVLESHGQNMIMIHRSGIPERVALRDFHEGVEFYIPYLAAPQLLPDFSGIHPVYANGNVGDHFEMKSLNCLNEMMIDALWFMNIGYLIMFIDDHFPCDEKELWSIVVEELQMYVEKFPQLKTRFEDLQLYRPECVIESLAQKRIYGSIICPPQPALNPLYKCVSSLQNQFKESFYHV